MVKIQIISDIHLESLAAYDVFEINPTAEYLALIGDIGHAKDVGLIAFIRKHLDRFKIIFYVLGNHEPYFSSWAASKQTLLALQTATQERSTRKFVLLDQTRYDLSPTITILGCTLFSNITTAQMDSVSYGLMEFYNIENWTVEQHVQHHQSDLNWLNAEVQKLTREHDRKIIIMTHHSPTHDARSIDSRHRRSNISSGFMTDLSDQPCFTSERVEVWALGHTHFNCDFVDEAHKTRVVTNQRGYYSGQSDNFVTAKTIEL
ncbi:ser/Thr protein phosphatase superfamily [Phaeosphaeria sp. MPI-PUGE-AT-0046c]|nr:ser/Thr protein phosphatase superfamily [Phaeosphaeria sp. MPI-PUGE-AT-0046c]